MENVLLKLRLVFWPFVRLLLLTAAGYAAVWAALVWLLGATLGVQLRAESGFLFFFLPLVSSMVVLRWLRPRLHLLEAGGKDIWRSLFYCITIIGIAVAAGTAASVAQEALLQLVSLRDASEVPRYPANTAFVLRQAYVARHRTE